jgi:hypothetical protein
MALFDWFGRVGRRLGGFWRGGRYQPREEPEEIMLRQKFEGNITGIEIEQEPAPEVYAIKRKAYVVWYSGRNYEIRREVAIDFWKNSDEDIDEETIMGWMNRATEAALGATLDQCQNWRDGEYVVASAETGITSASGPGYVDQTIQWVYVKQQAIVRRGSFGKS